MTGMDLGRSLWVTAAFWWGFGVGWLAWTHYWALDLATTYNLGPQTVLTRWYGWWSWAERLAVLGCTPGSCP